MGKSASTSHLSLIAGIVSAAALLWPAALPAQGVEAEGIAAPDFSGTWARRGHTTASGEHDPIIPSTFEPPPDGPSTIVTAVPHYGHCDVLPPGVPNSDPCPPGVTESRASNPWIADYTNPILQPWTREALKKNVDDETAGIPHLTYTQNCKPSGVPQIFNLRNQVQLLQASDQVTILYEVNQQVRRVYMNQEHPIGLERSWYGHSIGHYEGDTLVIDTIAQIDSTELDRFGTLHTDALHVVERYQILDSGMMQVIFTVEDQKAFTMPWRGVATYRRTGIPFPENICAENNRATFAGQSFDVPHDLTLDF